MKITLSGVPDELERFLRKALGREDVRNILNGLVEQEAMDAEFEPDDPELYAAMDELSWETFHLMHLVVVHESGRGPSGVVIDMDDLTALDLGNGDRLTTRQVAARVGGAHKVTNRRKIKPFMGIRSVGDSRRVIVFHPCIPTLMQMVGEYDEQYRDWLDAHGFEYPSAGLEYEVIEEDD